MSSNLKNLSSYTPVDLPDPAGLSIAIVVAEWNDAVTTALCDGAVETLLAHGITQEHILIYRVPGSYELIYACNRLSTGTGCPDGIIAIGTVVRGETPHFDFISQAVSVNLGMLNATRDVPIAFGVLTTDTIEQALDRAGGAFGNKGVEAAVALLQMIASFFRI